MIFYCSYCQFVSNAQKNKRDVIIVGGHVFPSADEH